MRIIGITGTIGSGKSTVSKILEKLGAKVIDADAIARDVVRKGEKALSEIVEFFGSEVLDTDGELNRKKMAGIVFGNTEKLQVLNNIVHKYVKERMTKCIEEAGNAGNIDTVVIDVPIPIKDGFIDIADVIWVVTADIETRIDRVMKRNGLTREEVLKRINSQMSEEEYLKLADKIVYNNGDLEELEKQVIEYFRSG